MSTLVVIFNGRLRLSTIKAYEELVPIIPTQAAKSEGRRGEKC